MEAANRILAISPRAKTCKAVGLLHFSMEKLGHTVVLAGPNGGGKSRILNIVATLAHSSIPLLPDEELRHGDQIAFKNTRINPRILRVLPNSSTLTSLEHYTIGDLDSAAAAVATNSFTSDDLADGTLPYIRQLCMDYLSATHPETQSNTEGQLQVVQQWKSLCALVEELLGHPLTPHFVKGYPTLFGQPFYKLSPGQIILLQTAVALHRDDLSPNGSLMFIDEPEKHLHPSVAAQLFSILRRLNPDGQIWIATHSIHLLSMCAPEDIWLVENHSARWVGKNPETALRSLMGDEDAQTRLADFLRLPAALAATAFAAECLGAPSVVMTPPEDPQNNQIRTVVQSTIATKKERLQILDWGAGRGRLAGALVDLNVEYHAFEPHKGIREECARNISSLAHASPAVISDPVAMIDLQDRFDIVVLCNVLHEIPPKKWSEYFGKQGLIARALRNDGHLLILEDYQLPHGEMAHGDGFLLLNRSELKALFDANDEEIITTSAKGREGRLNAHLVAKSAVLKYSKQGRDNAIQELKNRAKIKISEIRARTEGAVSYQKGREHALWVQLFANASLALE